MLLLLLLLPLQSQRLYFSKFHPLPIDSGYSKAKTANCQLQTVELLESKASQLNVDSLANALVATDDYVNSTLNPFATGPLRRRKHASAEQICSASLIRRRRRLELLGATVERSETSARRHVVEKM